MSKGNPYFKPEDIKPEECSKSRFRPEQTNCEGCGGLMKHYDYGSKGKSVSRCPVRTWAGVFTSSHNQPSTKASLEPAICSRIECYIRQDGRCPVTGSPLQLWSNGGKTYAACLHVNSETNEVLVLLIMPANLTIEKAEQFVGRRFTRKEILEGTWQKLVTMERAGLSSTPSKRSSRRQASR